MLKVKYLLEETGGDNLDLESATSLTTCINKVKV